MGVGVALLIYWINLYFFLLPLSPLFSYSVIHFSSYTAAQSLRDLNFHQCHFNIFRSIIDLNGLDLVLLGWKGYRTAGLYVIHWKKWRESKLSGRSGPRCPESRWKAKKSRWRVGKDTHTRAATLMTLQTHRHIDTVATGWMQPPSAIGGNPERWPAPIITEGGWCWHWPSVRR